MILGLKAITFLYAAAHKPPNSNIQEIATLRGHELFVFSVAFSPDGKLLASGGLDLGPKGVVKLWDVSKRAEITTLREHSNEIDSLAFSPDGELLASGSTDKTIKLWDVSKRAEITTLKGHSARVYSLSFRLDTDHSL
jgi:WD40 repeat protein